MMTYTEMEKKYMNENKTGGRPEYAFINVTRGS